MRFIYQGCFASSHLDIELFTNDEMIHTEKPIHVLVVYWS